MKWRWKREAAPSNPSGPLRRSEWQWAKSAYAIEVNPWVSREEAEAVLLFRGTIVAAYGYVESRLAEIAIRASRIEAYAGLRPTFPYAMDRRVAFLKDVFSRGPLGAYGAPAAKFLDRFMATTDLRHMMAHARMELVGDLAGWGATFHDYRPDAGGTIRYRRRRMKLAEIEHEAWAASRLSRLGQVLYVRLQATGVLPPIE